MKAMKICLVSQEYPPETGWGGIGTQTHLKARGLSGRGHEVHVVSATWSGEAKTYRDAGATVHRIPAPDLWSLGNDGPACWVAYSAAVAQKLQALTTEVGFDIIQFPEYAAEGFVYQLGTFESRQTRYVVQLHGPLAMFAAHLDWPPRDSSEYKVGCFLERTVIHHADLVLASSHMTAGFAARQYDYPLEHIHVIHSGIDTRRFRPGPLPPDARHPRVLFVGKVSEAKGITVLVEAILRLRERYPDIALRMLGKADDDLQSRLTQRIDAADATASFDFRGNVPYGELPEHYHWCDVFAGPSPFEPGPGNVYLEAMACGKPVVACNSGGTPESVLHQHTGLLVPPGEVGALTNALSQLLGDRDLRERLGKAGRAWVEQNFSLDAYTDKVERLYKDLLRP